MTKLKGATREWLRKVRDPPLRLGPCKRSPGGASEDTVDSFQKPQLLDEARPIARSKNRRRKLERVRKVYLRMRVDNHFIA